MDRRAYEQPKLERFGTFRDLTRTWPILKDWTEYCQVHPGAEECRTS
ncbi:MAG: lasso RiPP family leader peptide-containing protein [Gemmatimonadales bacterium]|nr:lasso RiPP family leader peptide-containing protein [Gemmatimonadales bacterium]